jgi:hypothetical protein
MYSERRRLGNNAEVIRLIFHDAAAVNAALRALLDIARRQVRATGPGA